MTAPSTTRQRFSFLELTQAAGTTNVSQLAEIVGVTRRTIHRWKQNGIPAHQADRAAINAGQHPGNVWPDQWWNAA